MSKRGWWPKGVSAGVAIPLIVGLVAIWQSERTTDDPNRFIVYGALLLAAVVAALWLGSSSRTWRWKVRSPIYRPKRKTAEELQAEQENEESTLRAHRELSELYRAYAKPAFDALKNYVEARRTELEEQAEPLRSVGLLASFMVNDAERDHREVENNLEGWTEFSKLEDTDQKKEWRIRLHVHRHKSWDLQWNFGMFFGAYEVMAMWAPRLAFSLGIDPETDPSFRRWRELDSQYFDKLREQSARVGMETLMELVNRWTIKR